MNMPSSTRAGFVALIGAPNAGKSTVTNNFVGSKVSIVSSKVQTTRTIVRGINIFENTQIVFVDTPGIFKPKRRLDRAMVSSAWSGAGDADIIVLVVDAKRGFDDETKEIVKKLNEQKREAVLLLNKIDLIKKEKLLALTQEINAAGNFTATFMVSALTGHNINDFYKYLADNLPEGPWFYPEDQISDMPLKLLAAEITREKLFTYLHEEIPYSLTVETDVWDRRDDGSIKVQQTIFVERDSQKKIVLGKNGSMIKRIGQSSRIEIEELLEERVHLFLFVKVRENWINDASRYEDWNLDFNA